MPTIGPAERTALIQPRIGIGDMIWHLPHIRALADAMGGHVTLVARPRSMADQLVGPADGVADVLWLERDQWSPNGRHQGMAGFAKLVSDLRARRFDAAILMTRSRNLAFAALAAAIPRRYGYGIGWQRLLMRSPALPTTAMGQHPYQQAGAWLEAAGIPLLHAEPSITVQPAATDAALARLGLRSRTFVVLGIGSSDQWKKWPPESFAKLAAMVLAQGIADIVLVAGRAERPDADQIIASAPAEWLPHIKTALDWNLAEVAALLQGAACYIGNDTAALNIAAAVGTKTYGLFGATPVLTHSTNIIAIVPPGGSNQQTGMAAITAAAVLAHLRPLQPTRAQV